MECPYETCIGVNSLGECSVYWPIVIAQREILTGNYPYCYTQFSLISYGRANKMARKKGTRIEEFSRKGSDGRYNDPKDARIQKKRLDKALTKLRDQ